MPLRVQCSQAASEEHNEDRAAPAEVECGEEGSQQGEAEQLGVQYSSARGRHPCDLQKGRVVERGTHDELISKSGEYAQLVKRQLQHSGGSSAPGI